jgi:hypothetical protein
LKKAQKSIYHSVADPDPGYGAFLISESRMEKNPDPDPGNTPDHFSESLETVFWVKKNLNSLMRIRIRDHIHPGFGMGKIGSGINIPDPQH